MLMSLSFLNSQNMEMQYKMGQQNNTILIQAKHKGKINIGRKADSEAKPGWDEVALLHSSSWIGPEKTEWDWQFDLSATEGWQPKWVLHVMVKAMKYYRKTAPTEAGLDENCCSLKLCAGIVSTSQNPGSLGIIRQLRFILFVWWGSLGCWSKTLPWVVGNLESRRRNSSCGKPRR